MPRPRTAADVRQFLANRVERPVAAAPTVVTDGSTATIRLYDAIDSWGGWWGLSADEMADAVDSLPADVTEIRLLVNSPGGDVFDGVAIFNILAAHPARVVAVVQGLAASAASYIAVTADELVMNPGSMLMIHDASTGVYGWADDLRQTADLLDKISDNIAALYARKAGGTVGEWRDRMLAETWYTAEEAVVAGLADRVDAPSEDDAPAAADPDPEPPSPFEDSVRTLTEIRRLVDTLAPVDADTASAETDTLTPADTASAEIDPVTGDDVTATGGDEPISRTRINAMRLALVSA